MKCISAIVILLTFAVGQAVGQDATPGPYTTHAGMITVGPDPEAPAAEMFYTGYTLDGADPAERPVTFLFNGGPGASSVYLHIGAIGPMTVASPGDGSLPSVPARLVPNSETWLDFTDLVFIDPVGTGYSRMLPQPDGSPGDPTAYWSVEGDLVSIARFIRAFLTANDRWGSPKAIAGESYGGMRVAALAKMLTEDHDVALNRAILISPALRSGLPGVGSRYGVLSSMMLLPSQAATAADHGLNDLTANGDDLATALRSVEDFALGEYLTGLANLGRSTPEEKEAFFAKVAALTGLDPDFVAFHRGRVDAATYARNLFRDDYKVIDRYDGTQATADPIPESDTFAALDRSLATLSSVLAAPFLDYMNNAVGYETERRYFLLSTEINRRWNRDSPLGAPDDLAYALTVNPDLKALVVHGYQDLITPYFASRYLLEQATVSDTARKRLYFGNYVGGHMFYLYDDSRTEFFKDVKGFYEDISD